MFDFTQRYWFRQIKFVIGLIFLLLMSGICAFHNEAPTHIVITGWVGLLFFGGGGLFVLYKKIRYRMQGRKYIMITEHGLVISNDVIPWSTITGIERWSSQSALILVFTNDSKEQIAKAGLLKRMNMWISYKMTRAVFSFSELELDGTLDDFVKQCQPYIKSNKKQ